jgi:hypothetical protein
MPRARINRGDRPPGTVGVGLIVKSDQILRHCSLEICCYYCGVRGTLKSLVEYEHVGEVEKRRSRSGLFPLRQACMQDIVHSYCSTETRPW